MAKRIRRASPLILVLLFLLAVMVFVPRPQELTYAATFTADNTNDLIDVNVGNGVCDTAGTGCTLRAAVMEANRFPGDDVIQLVSGTYTLTLDGGGADEDLAADDDLDILSDNGRLTIIGQGPGSTIIEVDGGDTFRVFEVIFGDLELRNLTIRNGDAGAENGGGIFNRNGNVTLRNVEMAGNTAQNGGAIYNEFGGVDILENSVIGTMSNPNTASVDGGGIYSEYTAGQGSNVINIDRSTVQYNSATNDGGGIFARDNGILNVTNGSFINNNVAGLSGGGLFLRNLSNPDGLAFTISDSTITANIANEAGSFAGSGLHIQDVNDSTINNTTISNNTANNGAGLLFVSSLSNSDVELTITNSTIDNNDSTAAPNTGGGGIANIVAGSTQPDASVGATINLSNSTVSNNDGNLYGGIWNAGVEATVNILNSTISSNSSGDSGGGIHNANGTVSLELSTVSGNSAQLTGAGIVSTGSFADLDVLRSTIASNDNSAGVGGGGIANLDGGNTLVQTSTISNNDSAGNGGGIHNSGTGSRVTTESVTIYGNSADQGGGIYNADNSTTIFNTLLASNLATTSGPTCFVASGSISSNGYNIISNSSSCAIDNIRPGLDQVDPNPSDLLVDPNLTINNGGVTATHRLREGSVAIDLGSCYPNENNDQRGTGFPRAQDVLPESALDDACDIGAFEVQSLESVIIGDFIWNDLNANGLQDPGEPGINGVNIELRNTGNTIVATTTTANNPVSGEPGYYRFDQALVSPTQELRLFIELDSVEAALPGSQITERRALGGTRVPNDSDFDEIPVDVDGDGDLYYTFSDTFAQGETRVDIDAGFFQESSIGDFVFLDVNGNGIQDGGAEVGVEGITVRLFQVGVVDAIEVTTTNDDPGTPDIDESGQYLFEELTPGQEYYVQFEIPEALADPPEPDAIGLTFTTPNAGGNDAADSDADPIISPGPELLAETSIFALEAGIPQLIWDAGVRQVGTISGLAWNDDNGDGIYQIGTESPIENYAVVLVDASTGNDVTLVNTGSDGTYSVEVPPGSYQVDFSSIPAPFDTITQQGVGGDETINSNAEPDSTSPEFGFSPPADLPSGGTLENINVGVFQSVSIEGIVWQDADADGVFDFDSVPGDDELFYTFEDITVTLLDGTGNVLSGVPSVTTDASGAYQFTGLPPGDYIVRLTLPDGPFQLSPQDVDLQPPNEDIDSDFNQATFRSDVFTLAGGDPPAELDAGITDESGLSGIVWDDESQGPPDGRYIVGETLVSGILVIALANDGLTELGRDTTDANGAYSITNLPTGPFILQFVVPNDRGFTTPGVGDEAGDSDADPYTGRLSRSGLSDNPDENVFDAGLVSAITIGDLVFNDLDADGVLDAGEPGLPDIVVRLFQAGFVNQLTDVTTDANGLYNLKVLPNTEYELRFEAPAGFTFTEPNVAAAPNENSDSDAIPTVPDPDIGVITLTTTDISDLTNDAGLYAFSDINGTVFDDTNGNGLRDPGEPGVGNVEVTLLDDMGATVTTVTTSTVAETLGQYAISDLPAGDYTLAFDPPLDTQGFTIQDVNSNNNDDRDSDVNRASGRFSFTLTSAQSETVDAGLFAARLVRGTVWNDADGDGLQDGGPDEGGIPGVNVTLLLSGTPLDTIQTDTAGNYEFFAQTGPTLQYILQFERPTGYLSVPQDAGDDAIDSDIDEDIDDDGISTIIFQVPDGTEPIDYDAGYEPLASLGGLVFTDVNGNGVYEPGGTPPDTPVVGLEVNLYDAGDLATPIQGPVLTNDNGRYTFAGLVTGDYVVEFVLPADSTSIFTIQNATANEELDSDADPANGQASVSILEGEQDNPDNQNINAGLIPGNTISGFVFRDIDADGLFEDTADPPETGIAGITVNIYEDDGGGVAGALVDTVITDVDGNYTSSELSVGDYVVEVVLPTDAVFSYTLQDQLGSADIEDTGDSDVDSTTGQVAVTVPPDAVDPIENVEAGLIPGNTISGLVFRDEDADGLYEPAGDPAEVGIENVTVNIYEDAGGGTPGNLVDTVTTDVDGNYTSTELAGGDYVVEIVIPADSGFSYTLQDQVGSADPEDTGDSDIDATTGQVAVTLQSGVGNSLSNIDGGLIPGSTVSGLVFNDTDFDGIYEPGDGETGIEAVTVNVYVDPGASPLGTPVNTVQTNTNGDYTTRELAPGDYILEFVTPAGFAITLQDVGGSEANDSDVDPATGQVSVSIAAGAPSPVENISAGFVQPASIGDLVFEDLNGNGLRNTGEPGVSGVTVNLLDENGDPLSPPISDVTDVNGNYSFDDLNPGSYIVEFIAPTGSIFTTPNVGGGSNEDTDSDAIPDGADPTLGRTEVLVLSSGDTLTNVDAGITVPAELAGFFFNDRNGNGIQDAGETGEGLSGATVSLFNADTVQQVGPTVTLTASDTGAPNFQFTDIPPGNYFLSASLPAGFTFSPINATNDDADSDITPTPGSSSTTPPFTIQSGATVTNVDIGAFEATTIGGRVFFDANDNNQLDTGESGRNGVRVELYRNEGPTPTLLNTTTTTTLNSLSGSYRFDVAQGAYQIVVVPDPGQNFTFSTADAVGNDAIDSDVDSTGTVSFTVPGAPGFDIENINAGLQQPVQPLVVTKYGAPNDGSLPVGPGDVLTWVVCAENDSLRPAVGAFIEDTVDSELMTVNTTEVYYGIGSAAACPTSGVPGASSFRNRVRVPANNITAEGGNPPVTRITTPNDLTLQPGDYLLLTIQVTIADPTATDETTSVPVTDSGVLAMSTLFLVLGWFSRRLLQSWRTLGAALLVAVMILGVAPTLNDINAEQGGDTSPALAQTDEEEEGRWVRYDSTHPALEQVGNWEIVPDHRATGGSYLQTKEGSAALVLNGVTGTLVRLVYPQAWNTAQLAVLADTLQIGLIDGFNLDTINFVTSESFVLPGGASHTVRIQSTGSAANPAAPTPLLMVDAVDIWVPTEETPADTSNLTGVVWSDSNDNDALDPDDRLLEGVQVDLFINFGTNDTLIDSYLTDSFGRYVFTSLPNDDYWLVIRRDTLPTDIDPTSVDWTPIPVPTPHEGDVIIPSAEVLGATAVTGTAWLDVDRSASVSSEDVPLANVDVTLYQDDGSRTFNPGGSGDFPVGSMSTADEGGFSFDGLLPGIYWLDVDTASLPEAADNDQIWELMWLRIPEVSEVNLVLLPEDDGFALSGTAYADNNLDEVVDSADAPLEGVTIRLYADDGDNFFSEDLDTLMGEVVTDSDGNYQIDDLATGIHWLIPDMSALPADALQTQHWEPMWVRLPEIESADVLLLPAADSTERDFVRDGNAVLSGVVFNDDNGNRRYDERNESGIRNTIVELHTAAGDLIDATEVDENGVYSFAGLPNGTYQVRLLENTLPANFMDTVGFGGHGEQNPQTVEITGALRGSTITLNVEGPNFAYALDTDGDGSPDGREGAGDRDNDDIPNYLDPFDPTGIVYASDLFGNTKPIQGVEIELVYREGSTWVRADTIQPNPQRTNSLGAYRFDLNVLEQGLPPDGSQRVFHLQVEGLNADELIFPSVMNDAGRMLIVDGANAQVAPSLEPSAGDPFYLTFQADAGDDDISNNKLGADALLSFDADLANTGCANFVNGEVQCASASISFEVEVEFSLSPLADAATVFPGDEDVTFEHTLTNDGPLPDRYRIELNSDTAYESQTLTISTQGGTELGSIGRGGSFDTDVLNPGESLTLVLEIDVPTTGLGNGDTNDYQITATSLGAAELNTTLSETATDTLTVQAACITGNVFRDDDGDGFADSGEGISGALLNAYRVSATEVTEIAREVTTIDDGRGSYSISVPLASDDATIRVEVVESSLPAGTTFVNPTDNDREVNVEISDTDCAQANFIISVRDVSISKRINGTTEVQPGEQVFFTVLVANGANSSPVSGVVADTLSTAAFDLTSITSSATPNNATAQLQSSGGSLVGYAVTLQPGGSVQIDIQGTIRSDITTFPLTFQNVATLDFQTVDTTPIQSNVVTVTVRAPVVDTDGDGVPDSEDPAPNDPTITGTEDPGTDDGTADQTDFGQGGPTTDPTGTGTDPTDPDNLPDTGYMPIEYILAGQEGSTDDGYETSHLSTAGRLVIGLGGLLVIALAVVAFRFYNNSETLYNWLQKRSPWIGMALLALIGLLFLGGSAGVLYTANDITGVVDTDDLLGLNDDAADDQLAQNNDTLGNNDGVDSAIDGDSDGDGIPDSIDPDNVSNDVNGVTWMSDDGDGAAQQLPTIGDDTQRFIIPSLNVYTKMVNAPRVGTTWAVDDFFNEVARLEGTAAPGMEGNLVIAGHVTHTRGLGPFRTLDRITLGDTVIVKDYDIEYTYYVTDIMEVNPTEVWVTDESDDAILTLITCSGWDAANRTYDKRLVVRARLDKWRIVDAGAEAAELGERTRYEVGQAEEVALEGEWDEFASYNTSEGTYFFSEDKEAGATFTFEGDKFRLSYVMFSNFGEFEVYLDGELLMTVDAYSPYSGFGSTNVIQTTPGRHTLEIRNTDRANDSSKGNLIALDAIDVWR